MWKKYCFENNLNFKQSHISNKLHYYLNKTNSFKKMGSEIPIKTNRN